MKSFQARTQASASSLSLNWANSRPPKPGSDGKFTLASTPLASRSRARSLRVVRAGNHVGEPRGLEAPLLAGLAGDGVEPHGQAALVLVDPELTPVLLDDVRSASLNFAGTRDDQTSAGSTT